MCLLMYLLNDLSPLNLLSPLMIREQLLSPLDPLDLHTHRQVLLHQLVLVQCG